MLRRKNSAKPIILRVNKIYAAPKKQCKTYFLRVDKKIQENSAKLKKIFKK